MAAGFPEGIAQVIAFSNQYVDDNPKTSPMPCPSFPCDADLGVQRRRDWHFTTLERRQELWEHFLGTGYADDLGKYLHTLQDSYSHKGLSAVNGQITLSNPKTWADADDTWRRVGLADEMAEDTYNHLDAGADTMEAKGNLPGRSPAMPWNRLSDLVHSFNQAQTTGEKNVYLGMLESRVRIWQRDQFEKLEKERNRRQIRESSRRKVSNWL